MNDDLRSEHRENDDRLADITNQVLDGQWKPDDDNVDDSEIAGLTAVVEKLNALVERDVPDPIAARRIKARLEQEWQGEFEKTAHPQSVSKSANQRSFLRPLLQFAGFAAVLAVLLLTAFYEPIQDFSATAFQNPSFVIGTVVGLACLAIIFLVATNRK